MCATALQSDRALTHTSILELMPKLKRGSGGGGSAEGLPGRHLRAVQLQSSRRARHARCHSAPVRTGAAHEHDLATLRLAVMKARAVTYGKDSLASVQRHASAPT